MKRIRKSKTLALCLMLVAVLAVSGIFLSLNTASASNSTTTSTTLSASSIDLGQSITNGATVTPQTYVYNIISVTVGTKSIAHGLNVNVNPSYPSHTGGVPAGNLIILQVLARGNSITTGVQSGFTPIPFSTG